MSHLDEAPGHREDATSKPDFMVWPQIPDGPITPPAGTSAPGTPASGTPAPSPRRRRRLAVRLLGLSLIVGLVLAGAGVGAFFLYQHDLDQNIGRIGNPFTALPERTRPKPAPNGVTNILLLGSDSQISADPSGWARGGQRTTAVMIAHIPRDRSRVTVTSIPRDSWVTVPGHGKNKINAAFSFGGPTLMVATVENLTGVRIDHVVIVDFEGFKVITDELGGVKVNVAKGAAGQQSGLAPGPQMMNGETALRYVQQRSVPGDDFDRVHRQQNWLRAVALKSLDKGTLTSPRRLTSVLGSLTRSIDADDGFSIGRMRSLAFSLHGLNGSDLTFLTAPVAGSGRSPDGKQSIVNLDAAANRTLWKAVADDTVADWLAAHPKAS